MLRVRSNPTEFADVTKLSGGAVYPVEKKDAIQKDLDRLKEYACVNLSRFNKAKLQGPVPGLGQLPVSTQAGE